jgi:hypothetical protein
MTYLSAVVVVDQTVAGENRSAGFRSSTSEQEVPNTTAARPSMNMLFFIGSVALAVRRIN